MALDARFSAEMRHGSRRYRPTLAPLAFPIACNIVAGNLRFTGILRSWTRSRFSDLVRSRRGPLLDRESGPDPLPKSSPQQSTAGIGQ